MESKPTQYREGLKPHVSLEPAKKKSKKASKPYVVSTADARHVKPLLEEIVKEHKWTETLSKTDCDLKWVTRSVDTKAELIPLLTQK
jgi:tubulin polyglutamylase TTLL6/13